MKDCNVQACIACHPTVALLKFPSSALPVPPQRCPLLLGHVEHLRVLKLGLGSEAGTEDAAVPAVHHHQVARADSLPDLGVRSARQVLSDVLRRPGPAVLSHHLGGPFHSEAIPEVLEPQEGPQGALGVGLMLLAGVEASAQGQDRHWKATGTARVLRPAGADGTS
eukprot:CAMPEP_0179048450 /NCGR_PEP_ID=MMETSP0796-20121207/19715_1 /TAXON_ID=73915 /ORGANISM="Pyrodinium bahamense, Strain pbaha01" /LENGTH=165 /DNA_ID=CAMNT_0020744919 /DNA_START=407 /DNA_END=904 /DNA_ORIENTATION=+